MQRKINKLIIIFGAVVFNYTICCSQKDSLTHHSLKGTKHFLLDSMQLKFKKDSIHLYRFQKVRPYFAIDQRNSFIKNQSVQINGYQFGTILYEHHTVGFGSYSINNHSNRNFKYNSKSTPIDLALNLKYLTAFYQYTLLDKRFIEIDLPFEIGYGGFQYTIKLKSNDSILPYKPGGKIVPFGVGTSIVIKPIKWIGLAATAGYRYVHDIGGNLKNVNVNFNGFYYSIGAWIDVRQIVRDARFYGIKRRKYRNNIKKINNGNYL